MSIFSKKNQFQAAILTTFLAISLFSGGNFALAETRPILDIFSSSTESVVPTTSPETLLTTGVGSTPFVFLRNLKEGSVGEDVRQLQKILNSDAETALSAVGIGSRGQETTYFGRLTRDAVIRFQNKYKNEVLRPAGQLSGTGFVGLWTRLKLNQILLNASVSETPVRVSIQDPRTSTPPDTATTDTGAVPQISALSRYSGRVGTLVSISGTGFSSENKVYFGANEIENVSLDGDKLRVTVPNISVGRYDVSVKTPNGASNKMPFMVVTPGANPPIIERVEPESAGFGDQITISGRNFTENGNIVSSGLGIINNLSSTDGKTLKFSIERPVTLSPVTGGESFEWPIFFTVVNTNGISQSGTASRLIIEI